VAHGIVRRLVVPRSLDRLPDVVDCVTGDVGASIWRVGA
jgi:hypothetical protein